MGKSIGVEPGTRTNTAINIAIVLLVVLLSPGTRRGLDLRFTRYKEKLPKELILII